MSGAVTIRLTGKLGGGGGLIVNTTHNPGKLRIVSSYSGASGVAVTGNKNAYMTILAPGTDVEISNGALFGTLFGRTLSLTRGTDIHVDANWK